MLNEQWFHGNCGVCGETTKKMSAQAAKKHSQHY